MNTSTIELSMNELEMVNGGITESEAMFMIFLGTKTGAIVGGFLGSEVPVVGTVVGAALGGAVGFIGGATGAVIRYVVEN